MNNQSESLHAALLRFKAKRSAAGGRQVKPPQLEATARHPIVTDQPLADEQNLFSTACDKTHSIR